MKMGTIIKIIKKRFFLVLLVLIIYSTLVFADPKGPEYGCCSWYFPGGPGGIPSSGGTFSAPQTSCNTYPDSTGWTNGIAGSSTGFGPCSVPSVCPGGDISAGSSDYCICPSNSNPGFANKVYKVSDGGNCSMPCVSSCACAASTCVGSSCSDGCSGTCSGTKTNGNCAVIPQETPSYSSVYDVISNSKQWYVCNATGTAPQFGDLNKSNYLENFQTLSNTILKSGNKWCPVIIPDDPDDYHYVVGTSFLSDCDDSDSNQANFPGGCCVIPNGNPANLINYNSPTGTGSAIDLFQYIGSDVRDCPVCYDWDGISISGGTMGGGSSYSAGLILREDITKDGLFHGNPFKSCINNNGRSCNEGESCTSRYREIASNQSVTCCYIDSKDYTVTPICVNDTGNPALNCVDMGGTLVMPTQATFCQDEIESKDAIGDYVCCKSQVRYDFPQYNNFDRFLCYKENNNSFFGECCQEDGCKNVHIHGNEFDKNNVFSYGSPLHIIRSFDNVNSGILQNFVREHKLASSNSFNELIFKNISFSDFDTLNFDIDYSSQINYPQTITFNFISGNCSYNIGNNLIYNFPNPFVFYFLSGVWYRASINYTDCTHKSSKFEKFIFKTNKSEKIIVRLDNLYLSKSSDVGSGGGYDTYYCSAKANTWVDSLNPPSGYDPKDFSAWGPYMLACNDQLSFSWTGSHCCGSNTKKDNYGEFYEDTQQGCFGGFPVPNNKRLSDALYPEPDYDKLLFYNEKFYACNTPIFENLSVSENGTPSSTHLVAPENNVVPYTIKGLWYCSGTDGWLNLSNAKSMPIIAATLKQMGEDVSPTNYSLHCGNASVLNLIKSPSQVGFNPILNDGFCVLRTQNSVVMGVPVNYSDVNTFLNNDLKQFHPFYKDTVVNNCTTFTSIFNSTQFYHPCSDVSDWLNASYNKPFGILLFSLKDDTLPNSAFLRFFVDFWTSIKDFFKSLFGVTPPTSYMSVPGVVEDFSFKELYINKIGDKVIKGVREKNTIVVSYINFSSNMSFLKDLTEKWFASSGANVVLQGEIGNQTIGINNTSKVNEFNWNYLTSNLKVQPPLGPPYT